MYNFGLENLCFLRFVCNFAVHFIVPIFPEYSVRKQMSELSNVKFGYKYPRPAITTDCVVFSYDVQLKCLNILLIERANEPYKGRLALPGGFMNISCETDSQGFVVKETNESLPDCARRELKEETGLTVDYLDEVGTWSTPGRDSRGITITDAYMALAQLKPVKARDDAKVAKWVPFKEVLNAIESAPSDKQYLAFDHDEIVLKAFRHLQQQICFGPVIYELLPKLFTMNSLQNVYEQIIGRHFDRRNFSRKILDSGVLDQFKTSGKLIFYSVNHRSYASFLKKGRLSNLIF